MGPFSHQESAVSHVIEPAPLLTLSLSLEHGLEDAVLSSLRSGMNCFFQVRILHAGALQPVDECY